jgi:hypothetical protein
MPRKDLTAYAMLSSRSVYVQDSSETAVEALLKVLKAPAAVQHRARAELAGARDILNTHAVAVLQKLAAADGLHLQLRA